jgi:galactokinase
MRRREAIQLEFAKLYGGPPSDWLRAPGRVDLMGSHTDYNDGHVLTMTVDRDTWIAVRRRDDRRVAIASLNLPGTADFSLAAIERDPVVPWTDYVRGAARVLQEDGADLAGFDALLHSSVPFGSGLSSSAAIEIATLLAFDAVGGSHHEPLELAILGQRVENGFVGVSCGILDQYTSVLGTAGHALLLDCRALRSRPVAIAADLAVVICDTRAPRQLAGTEYDERRAQCEAGAAHIAASTAGVPDITALRDISLKLFEAHEAELPAVVARRCRFILEEDRRALDLAEVLPSGDRATLARLFEASFRGAIELFEIGAPSMLAMHRAMEDAPGLVARRQAGAGFGGCLVALVEREAIEAFSASVARAYATATGIEPSVFAVEAAAGAGPLTSPPDSLTSPPDSLTSPPDR